MVFSSFILALHSTTNYAGLLRSCTQLACCYVSAHHVGSGIKALGQFSFICICCQNNVFILQCPSQITSQVI